MDPAESAPQQTPSQAGRDEDPSMQAGDTRERNYRRDARRCGRAGRILAGPRGEG